MNIGPVGLTRQYIQLPRRENIKKQKPETKNPARWLRRGSHWRDSLGLQPFGERGGKLLVPGADGERCLDSVEYAPVILDGPVEFLHVGIERSVPNKGRHLFNAEGEFRTRDLHVAQGISFHRLSSQSSYALMSIAPYGVALHH